MLQDERSTHTNGAECELLLCVHALAQHRTAEAPHLAARDELVLEGQLDEFHTEMSQYECGLTTRWGINLTADAATTLTLISLRTAN